MAVALIGEMKLLLKTWRDDRETLSVKVIDERHDEEQRRDEPGPTFVWWGSLFGLCQLKVVVRQDASQGKDSSITSDFKDSRRSFTVRENLN